MSWYHYMADAENVLICCVGIYITNEERKGKNGFLELKSILKRMHDSEPNNLTIWCMAVSPVPGDKVRKTSSAKVTFSLGELSI